MKEHTLKKHRAIQDNYLTWDAKRYKGKRIYTDQYVFLKIAEKFYLSPNTVERIIFSRL